MIRRSVGPVECDAIEPDRRVTFYTVQHLSVMECLSKSVWLTRSSPGTCVRSPSIHCLNSVPTTCQQREFQVRTLISVLILSHAHEFFSAAWLERFVRVRRL